MAGDTDVTPVKRSGLATYSGKDAQDMADELVRGAITSLKGDITVPSFKDLDMSGVFKTMDKAAASTESADANLGAQRDAFEEATNEKKKGLDSKAAAEGDAARADQEKAQQIANTHNSLAESMGFDMNTEAAILGQSLTEMRPEIDAKLKEIQDLQEPGDPLEWLANQFILPGKINAYNAVATRFNAGQATINETIETAQNLENFQNRGIATITAGQAAATAKKALAEAEINKGIADQELAKQNITFSQQKLSNDMALAMQTEQMTGMQQRENQMKFAAQITAINVADTHAKRQLEAAKLLEMLEDKNALKILIAKYDVMMGHPEGTFSLAVFKALPKDKQDNIVAIGAGSLGSDPWTAAKNFYANKPSMGVSAETLTLMKYIVDTGEPIMTSLKVQNIDEKQKDIATGLQIKAQLIQDYANASKPGTIFHEFSPNKMIASGAIPKDSRLAAILEPLTKTNSPVPSAMIMQTIAKEIPNPNEAGAVIAAYYKKNIELRNSVMNTGTMGVQAPTSYILRDSLSPLGIFRAQFDLTKPEDATKWLLFQKQKQQLDKGPSGIGGFG